jgi:OmpA-OmpF porin, OOP family
MPYRIIFTLFLTVLNSALFAQDSTRNLLLNPSFELSKMKRPNFRFKDEIEFDTFSVAWTTQKKSSPDIIDSLFNYKFHEYSNMTAKRIIPHHGAQVVGIRLFGCEDNNFIDCREYLVQKLSVPLKKDHYYRFELWMARLEKSYACQDLSVYFSDTLIRKDYFLATRRLNPQIRCHAMPGKKAYYWYRLADTILADKDFTTIYIGSFVNDNAATVDRVEADSYRQSYYFVDDVKLVDLGPRKIRKPVPIKTSKDSMPSVVSPSLKDSKDSIFNNLVASKKPFVFKNLLFESAKADILPHSFIELDSIFQYLKINIQLKIKIEGHTDDEGSTPFNQDLSERRAKAVADYFIKLGIDKNRLNTEGFGETRHVSNNKTKEGKQLNRRVEMFLNE